MAASRFVPILGAAQRMFVLADATEADGDLMTALFLAPANRSEQEFSVRCGATLLPRHTFYAAHVFPA